MKMSIDFAPERWEKIKEIYSKWWEGELDRPLIPVILQGKDPGRDKPKHVWNSHVTFSDLSISPKEIIDSLDYELSKNIYLGDAYPYVSLDCSGPGIVAAFLGADIDCSTGRIWFHPKELLPINELHFKYDPENIWLNRVKDICREAMHRWKGQVLVGMPDLGGVLDILATFRTTNDLLMDLYDDPDEVKRLTWEIHDLWHKYYNEINEILQPVNPGYSDWAQIYSDKPSYVPQSDFCYMIGTSMFDEFVKPELEATFKKIPRTLYHLDGVGELPHLDSLLEIAELDAVQWMPGDGKPDQAQWPDVYRKIHAAGKKIQINHGDFECIDAVAKQIGTRKGIHKTALWKSISDETEMRNHLREYGIE
jgi:hypothetical protein